MMTKRAAKHVRYSANNGKWVVCTSGRLPEQVVSFDTQKEAVVKARSEAKKARVDLVIHGRNGRIRDVDSYSKITSAKKLLPTR